MDKIEYSRSAIYTIDGLVALLIKEELPNLFNIDVELRNILKEYKFNKTGKNFINAVINRDTNNIFYKYLLEVLSPLDTNKSKERVCNKLIFDIKEYVEEGLSDRLQLQLDTHNDIMAEESITNAPHLRYPLTLTKLYRYTTPDKIDNAPTKYKSPESMRVVNTIPVDTAVICSEFYCDGDRDPRIVSVVMELSTILVNYNKLYFNNVVTKYDETNCITTSIIHGIDSILPEHISALELNPDSWDYQILHTILDLQIPKYKQRSHYNIIGPPFSIDILDELMLKFKNTSSFDVRDLISMVLGYNDLEFIDTIIKARLVLSVNTIDYYF